MFRIAEMLAGREAIRRISVRLPSDVVGSRKPVKLGTIQLVVSEELAAALAGTKGLYFSGKSAVNMKGI